MKRITLKLDNDSLQGLEVPSNKTIEEVAAQFMEIAPAVQQAINRQFGTPQERAAERISRAEIIAELNQAISDTSTPPTLPGTAALALPVIQTFITDTTRRQNRMLKLLKLLTKDDE